MTLGKNISLKGTNPHFFSPPFCQKSLLIPAKLHRSEGGYGQGVCTCPLVCCSASIPPALRLAKMQVSFFSFFIQILKRSWGSGAFAGGEQGSLGASKPLTPCIPVCRARHACNFTILPSSGTAERCRHGVFFPSIPPFLHSLHAGGGGETRQRKRVDPP